MGFDSVKGELRSIGVDGGGTVTKDAAGQVRKPSLRDSVTNSSAVSGPAL